MIKERLHTRLIVCDGCGVNDIVYTSEDPDISTYKRIKILPKDWTYSGSMAGFELGGGCYCDKCSIIKDIIE